MELTDIFAHRLRGVIQESGKTRKQIAEEVRISYETLRVYIRGDRRMRPNIETLANLCKYLGVSADYLLGLTEEKR